jgi:hypothetical protein
VRGNVCAGRTDRLAEFLDGLYRRDTDCIIPSDDIRQIEMLLAEAVAVMAVDTGRKLAGAGTAARTERPKEEITGPQTVANGPKIASKTVVFFNGITESVGRIENVEEISWEAGGSLLKVTSRVEDGLVCHYRKMENVFEFRTWEGTEEADWT